MVKTTYQVTYEYQYGDKNRAYQKTFENEHQCAQFMYIILDRDTENLNLIMPYSITFQEAVLRIDSFVKELNPMNYYILKKIVIHSAN